LGVAAEGGEVVGAGGVHGVGTFQWVGVVGFG
jgi:hypothetical protein